MNLIINELYKKSPIDRATDVYITQWQSRCILEVTELMGNTLFPVWFLSNDY